MLKLGLGRDQKLYAYRQIQTREEYRPLHVVRTQKRVLPKAKKRVIKKKKINPIIYLIRLSIVFSFLGLFMYFIQPTCFNRLIKQVIYPNRIHLNTGSPEYLVQQNRPNIDNVDAYSISHPVTNYIWNDLFLNRQLLTPTIEKNHSEVSTMYQTGEHSELKNHLFALMKEYPTINPAIYVWEYENGKYIDINANKQYSAASIIKLPVLVRLFKSIESQQLTIYDDMILTDYYKSPGSGDLQYAQTGAKYTIDALAKTMIQDSDNTSTNMIMSKLGGMDDINTGLRDWGISQTYVRTWLPDLNGTNKTTAKDMAKILYNLDNPGFLNINSREYITDYMSHVKNNKLIAAGLGEGALFMHKTGDIGTMLGDAGIVYAPNGKKYIIVILANRPYNSPLGKDFIVRASSLIYKSIVG